MFLKWSDKFSVGVEEFDSQHKNLMNKINAMHTELKKGNKKEKQSMHFDELIRISKEHFSSEEKELESKDYDNYLEHIDEHENLLNELNDFRERYLSDKLDIDVEFIDFLGNWLFVHITETDMGYKDLF